MPVFETRLVFNVPGRYYVGKECSGCNQCTKFAPRNFRFEDTCLQGFVFKQPETPEEEAACAQATLKCPSGAVAADGDRHDWTASSGFDPHKKVVEPEPPPRPWWKLW